MLKVESLHQAYGGSHILRGLSFEVKTGEVTTLLGRNGVGKTTLLKSLMGLVRTREGRITFDGRDITQLPPHERVRAGIGYVPQGREIFPRLTVEENLLMGLATKPGSARIPERIFEMFPVLAKMMHRRGGDALAMEPKLLILDEPTEGIQPSIIKDIERAIRLLAQTGEMAILLVEQYYDFAESLADQYLLMERGEFIMRGRGETMPQDGVREALAV